MSYDDKEESLRLVFQRYDTNRDSKINRQEFRDALIEICPGMNVADEKIIDENFRLFLEKDTDKDGEVSFEEFKAYVHKLGL
jgi:calcium-binding protein CML